jgi:hypothetical protein
MKKMITLTFGKLNYFNNSDMTLLRESERMKTKCGEKHFAEFSDVRFQAVGSLGDLNTMNF